MWLALAMLFSIIFRSAATAALSALGLWLFILDLWPSLSPFVVGIFLQLRAGSADELLSGLSTIQALQAAFAGSACSARS